MNETEFMEILAATMKMRPTTKEKPGRGRFYWFQTQSRGGALIGRLVRAGETECFTPLTAVADEAEPGQWGRDEQSLDLDEYIGAADALGMDRKLACRIHDASRYAPENNESATAEIRRLRCELLDNTEEALPC